MIAELEAAIEELCSTDPAALADTAAIKSLHRCLARLEAATTGPARRSRPLEPGRPAAPAPPLSG